MLVAINITTDTALLRLMQLSSASLPVGGYSFSQGLEYAVEAGWITSQEQTAEWLRLVLQESIAKADLPLLIRLYDAARENDKEQFDYWNANVLACRETKEMLLTETAMGAALIRLFDQLDINISITATKNKNQKVSFLAAFAIASAHWKIEERAALVGYLWSWIENQVAAATKLVPLGQTAAQKLLLSLGKEITPAVEKAKAISDEDIGSSLPGLAMASTLHETQYSRLFRS